LAPAELELVFELEQEAIATLKLTPMRNNDTNLLSKEGLSHLVSC